MTGDRPLYGTLERVSGGAGLRTQAVHGWAYERPAAGSSFVLVGKALDPEGEDRLVRTSQVVEVRATGPGVWELRTLNSTYRFTEDERPN